MTTPCEERAAPIAGALAAALVLLAGCGETAPPGQRAPAPAPADASRAPAVDQAGVTLVDAAPLAAPDAAAASPGSWRVTIAAVGDVIPHDRVKAPARGQAQRPDRPGDDRYSGWSFVLGKLAPSLAPADLAVANLESPIAEQRKRPDSNPPVLNGPPALLDALAGLGFDAVALANNHLNDQLPEGIGETVAAARAAGLEPFGAGPDRAAAERPIYLTRDGVRIALVAWTFAINRAQTGTGAQRPWVARWDKHQAFKAVTAARDAADLVVAIAHWGAELKPEVFSHQRNAAELLCGAGADLVLGSGPHILQPVEWVEHAKSGRRCLVAYSLGNVVSNQGLKYRYRWKPPDLEQAQNVPATRDGLLLRVTFAGGDGAPSVEAIAGVPLWTENNFIDRFVTDTAERDRIWVEPILPRLEQLDAADEQRKLLEQRLRRIEERVGALVELVPR